ncbi:MAG TPA: hypothetical protein PLS90_07250 [Candidatus Sumerlaeota bacterium]|nr:hypothetical protein [Candidatus Sumerlaeota bacterium]HOR27297.1 hypothetical protein [Candidatus Sumerlaeota bacterium]HPK02240.1 hypothetical protein [Candidatus Sumerlaeota bacterium]
MTDIKIAVIGGGSVNWMPVLMRDLYQLEEATGGEIRLCDPNQEHTRAVVALLQRYNELRGKRYAISVHEDRRRALAGADFVLTTFSPGAMDAFHNDLEIPIKYGVRQPVSMTVGPSGISAAIRTVPVAYAIVEEMEEVCPRAWLLNVTNPMTTVTRAMNMASRGVPVIGMCHEFHEFSRYVGVILGLERPAGIGVMDYLYRWLAEQGLEYRVAGINHFIWLTEARLHGEDVIPRIRQFARDHWDLRPAAGNGEPPDAWANYSAAKLALCRTFGYMPLAGDRHLIEFWPSLCNQANGFGMRYGVHKTTVDLRRHMKERQLAEIERVARGEQAVHWQTSGEEMSAIIRSVLTGRPTTAIINAPNRGQIDNLPDEVVVETLATVSSAAIEPMRCGPLPAAIAALCRLHCAVQELTVRAALAGDRDLLIEAFSLDPLCAAVDFAQIPRLVDDLLEANRPWLPRFFETRARRGGNGRATPVAHAEELSAAVPGGH